MQFQPRGKVVAPQFFGVFAFPAGGRGMLTVVEDTRGRQCLDFDAHLIAMWHIAQLPEYPCPLPQITLPV